MDPSQPGRRRLRRAPPTRVALDRTATDADRDGGGGERIAPDDRGDDG